MVLSTSVQSLEGIQNQNRLMWLRLSAHAHKEPAVLLDSQWLNGESK